MLIVEKCDKYPKIVFCEETHDKNLLTSTEIEDDEVNVMILSQPSHTLEFILFVVKFSLL